MFDAFTFNLYKKEVSRKRIRSVKQNDGTMKEIQEDEVLYEKTDEDPVTVATTSTTLTVSYFPQCDNVERETIAS